MEIFEEWKSVENLEKINSENKKNIYFCKIRSMPNPTSHGKNA